MPTQIERLARVEEKVDILTEKVNDFIKAADSKYASKLTQVIVYGLVASVLFLFFKLAVELPLTKPSQQTVTITTQNPDGSTTTRTVPTGTTVTVPATTPANPSSSTSTQPSQSATQQQEPKKSTLSQLPVIGGLFK